MLLAWTYITGYQVSVAWGVPKQAFLMSGQPNHILSVMSYLPAAQVTTLESGNSCLPNTDSAEQTVIITPLTLWAWLSTAIAQ